ncbi:MAG: YkvA family protein [Melioribacteraceae bacterium]|nr:YkvA family protein [Melioribacteraceae bacterium]
MNGSGKKYPSQKILEHSFNYMTDPSVAWYRKSIVVGALVYFITPIDAIPDIAPLIGYLDDLGVITAVLRYLGHELMQYYNY